MSFANVEAEGFENRLLHWKTNVYVTLLTRLSSAFKTALTPVAIAITPLFLENKKRDCRQRNHDQQRCGTARWNRYAGLPDFYLGLRLRRLRRSVSFRGNRA